MPRHLSLPGLPRAAVLHEPEGPLRGGLVAPHGASDGRARQPLFDHLAEVLAPGGIAVLAYERRAPQAPGSDVALDVQAADAIDAMQALAAATDRAVAVLGFSQGAWAAALAASQS